MVVTGNEQGPLARTGGEQPGGARGLGAKRATFIAATAVAAVVGTLAPASPTFGQTYECTPAPEASRPTTQAWHRSNRCIPIHIDENAPLFDGPEALALVEESLAVWTTPDCTDLQLVLVGRADERPGFDPSSDRNRNVISEVLNDTDRLFLPDPSALATTVTFHNVETGEIYDADILFNRAATEFVDVTSVEACAAEPEPPHDLANTLVHELGHVIGFDHNGDRRSTMFASAPACEISKRDLTSTDLVGLCDVYPSQQPTRTCLPPDEYGSFDRFRNQCDGDGEGGGCAAVPTSTTGAGLLAVAAWWLARRRKRFAFSGR